MHIVTSTELARNLSRILDRLAIDGEEVLVERNNRQVARMLSVPAQMTALEALGDLYRTISPSAAEGWIGEAKTSLVNQTVKDEGRDPWVS
jgi:antitoxin (DNA-binding transcriptional repressor) of toxin-antitoxin stability system